jgi:hypothetical protein
MDRLFFPQVIKCNIHVILTVNVDFNASAIFICDLLSHVFIFGPDSTYLTVEVVKISHRLDGPGIVAEGDLVVLECWV